MLPAESHCSQDTARPHSRIFFSCSCKGACSFESENCFPKLLVERGEAVQEVMERSPVCGLALLMSSAPAFTQAQPPGSRLPFPKSLIEGETVRNSWDMELLPLRAVAAVCHWLPACAPSWLQVSQGPCPVSVSCSFPCAGDEFSSTTVVCDWASVVLF